MAAEVPGGEAPASPVVMVPGSWPTKPHPSPDEGRRFWSCTEDLFGFVWTCPFNLPTALGSVPCQGPGQRAQVLFGVPEHSGD